jgi:pantothenate kinase-related protein Tda10
MPVATRDARWFNVRIMPYRTLEDRIDGVVITFADITAARRLEAKLRARHASTAKRGAAHSVKRATIRGRGSSDAADRRQRRRS